MQPCSQTLALGPLFYALRLVLDSQVRPDWKPIVASLGALYAACAPAAQQPGRKREMDDNSKRLGGLFWRLNKGDVSDDVIARLKALCGALDERNYPYAQQIQVGVLAGLERLACARLSPVHCLMLYVVMNERMGCP